MRQTIYDVTVTRCGAEALEMLKVGMAVLFGPETPEFLADIVFQHTGGKLTRAPRPGDVLEVDGKAYRVSKVGEVVEKNLGELGHSTVCFGDAGDAGSLPGSIQVDANSAPAIHVGTRIRIESASS